MRFLPHHNIGDRRYFSLAKKLPFADWGTTHPTHPPLGPPPPTDTDHHWAHIDRKSRPRGGGNDSTDVRVLVCANERRSNHDQRPTPGHVTLAATDWAATPSGKTIDPTTRNLLGGLRSPYAAADWRCARTVFWFQFPRLLFHSHHIPILKSKKSAVLVCWHRPLVQQMSDAVFTTIKICLQ